ncbi:hypothetical protein FVE85_6902 [Porphyridium purpureum]|uniref:DNA recombination-mediator protein A n=1 Tax=Porphyridium purpureum TaxID=35688 RepID=A0A5J4Z9J5_PORPP|nr:hypothetical protein FVE85_6902 [Porphyridium purpureum]|eukprot:POR0184..scf295_1
MRLVALVWRSGRCRRCKGRAAIWMMREMAAGFIPCVSGAGGWEAWTAGCAQPACAHGTRGAARLGRRVVPRHAGLARAGHEKGVAWAGLVRGSASVRRTQLASTTQHSGGGGDAADVRASGERSGDEDDSNRRARDGEFIDPERESERSGGAVATLEDPERRFDTVLQELAAIQNDGPRRVAVLGTRHMSYLHQQIVELLTYANLLVGNHVITSGAAGTNAAVIRGALRAEKSDLLTVVLPQSLSKQPLDIQEQLKKVRNLVQMSENDSMPLSVASQLCNSNIISRSTHFIAFAFHDSDVVLEAAREAKSLSKIVTLLYLD